jgi:hypothetical protein
MEDGTLLAPGETKTDDSGCSKVSCKLVDEKVNEDKKDKTIQNF